MLTAHGDGAQTRDVTHADDPARGIVAADAVRATGALPICVDVDPATSNLDPARLRGAITDRTCTVLAGHRLGMPCDLAAILAVAEPVGIPVVEDAAGALGSEAEWYGALLCIGRPHGAAWWFSFRPRTLCTTGDGGMVITAGPEMDAPVRMRRAHGADVSPRACHEAGRVWVPRRGEPGFSVRLTDLPGALGRVQLTRGLRAVARLIPHRGLACGDRVWARSRTR